MKFIINFFTKLFSSPAKSAPAVVAYPTPDWRTVMLPEAESRRLEIEAMNANDPDLALTIRRTQTRLQKEAIQWRADMAKMIHGGSRPTPKPTSSSVKRSTSTRDTGSTSAHDDNNLLFNVALANSVSTSSSHHSSNHHSNDECTRHSSSSYDSSSYSSDSSSSSSCGSD